MVDFASAETEQDFIESIRDIFRAYVPESDAWAQPNFFSINATVIGGLAWSGVMEARRGFDTRVNLQTAQGEFLDLIAATPPLNLSRLPATVATGFASVSNWPTATIPAGTEFQTAAGVKFTADEITAVTGGFAIVALTSVLPGKANNSKENQPLESGDAVVVSMGIYGGYDAETDDQFRARIYAEQTKYSFFGSPCSYERLLITAPGVSRAWTVEDGGVARIVFLMEDKYPCGEPQAEDITDIQQYLDDPCLTPLYFCHNISGACSRSIDLVIEWATAPEDICEIERALETWLRANYGLGEGVRGCDIDQWLRDNYFEYGPVIDCCEDFPPVTCCVYNCANLTPSCDDGSVAPPGLIQLNNWALGDTIEPGQSIEGDLNDTNPDVPPGGIWQWLSQSGDEFNVICQDDGTFEVVNECEEGGTIDWSFVFEYRIGESFDTAVASGQLQCGVCDDVLTDIVIDEPLEPGGELFGYVTDEGVNDSFPGFGDGEWQTPDHTAEMYLEFYPETGEYRVLNFDLPGDVCGGNEMPFFIEFVYVIDGVPTCPARVTGTRLTSDCDI